MKIVPIHYKHSRPVKDYSEIVRYVVQMAEMIDKKAFVGVHKSAYALAHCQVSNEPLAFFVLDTQLVKGRGEDESLAVFENRVIINPKIIEAPIYFTDKKAFQMFRGHDEFDGKELIPGKTPNAKQYMEGCMSFPFRHGKKIQRYNKIRVSYQIAHGRGLKTITTWLEGLPSQVFQHEFDHIQGENIFFKGKK